MVPKMKWTQTAEDQYEARGNRRYVIRPQGEKWMVLAYTHSKPGVTLWDPVSRPTLGAAKQLAQAWETELKVWTKVSRLIG